MEKQLLRNFVLSVLDDDHGVSTCAWDNLQELLQAAGEFELIGELSALVGCCDDRVYIK